MIETKVMCKDPIIIHHKVYLFSDVQQIRKGINEAVEIIRTLQTTTNAINFLLDFSSLGDTTTYSIAAHREWANGFKNNSEIQKCVRSVAVIGKDSPAFRAEKEHMEDEFHKWFTDFDEALRWLQSGNR